MSGLLEEDQWSFFLVNKLSSFTHIKVITLGAGEEVDDEVVGGACGMGVERIDEVGDRASEGQAAGVYGTSFTAGSLARVCVR